MKTTAYRYPGEHAVLAITLLLVGAVIALSAAATICGSLLFVIAFLALSYSFTRSQHDELMRAARPITPQTAPQIAGIIQQGAARLRPGPIEVYLLPSPTLNAYTFGLSSPKTIVAFSSLLNVMDAEELLFVLGHEMGHVALGHTWLNSMIGGVSGIPSSFGAAVILRMAFLWWNRSCELSADRAGLLACGKPEKAISALVKLAAGGRAYTASQLEQVYRQLDREDDNLGGILNEALATHPMLIRRINAIRSYATSQQYQRLSAAMSRQSL